MLINQQNSRAMRALGLALVCLGALNACKTEEKLPKIGEQIAGPVDVVSSPSGELFYVLNSDYERKFGQGSLLLIDPLQESNQAKIASIPTPRMGRSLHVSQNLLLVTYDALQSGGVRQVEIYDLKDEKKPSLLAELPIACSPLNGIIAPSQPYFAVSCLNGDIYLGRLGQGNSGTYTLDRIRSYGYAHRALYFHEGATATHLLGFPTDTDFPDAEDFLAIDAKTYDLASDSLSDLADDIPDRFQETLQARRRPAVGYPYQMFVYNLSSEEAASASEPGLDGIHFRYLPLGTFAKPNQANQEMRYVYFDFKDPAGVAIPGESSTEANQRFYRSNFWSAQPSLDGNKDVFYLSQRGNALGSASNNVLKFTIRPAVLSGSQAAKFSDIFAIERVYGSAVDRQSPKQYNGSFVLAQVGGEALLLVNQFRDLINFRDSPYYAITRKFLNPPRSNEAASSYDTSDYRESFNQLAVSGNGKVLTCSFYGRALFLFDANPQVSMKDQTPIRIE